MYGYIYLTTNLINGRKYIGQKKSSYFKGTEYLGSGKILKQAIEKYGWNSFRVELVEECNSKEELDEKERYWIKEYGAVDSPEFYNIAFGGQSRAHRPSLEERQRISEIAKSRVGEQNPFYGRTHSQETKEVLRIKSRKNWRRCLPSQKGKIWVTNGEINHLVFEDDIPEGFRKGVTHSDSWTESQRKRRKVKISLTEEEVKERQEKSHQNRSLSSSKRNENRVWINDGSCNKFVHQDRLSEFLSQGFVVGRLQDNKGHKDTFFVTNGVSNKLVKSEDEIPEGWWKGMTRHANTSNT